MNSTFYPKDEVFRPSESACDIADAIRYYHRESNSVRARLLEQIALFDERGLAESFGAVSTASWLARELKYPAATAYEYVRIGRKLREFPLLAAAFEEGRIDYSTVRFIIGYLTAENEADLVELAATLCHSELRQALASADHDMDDNEDPDAPYLRMHTRDDGMVSGSFLLPAVIGEQLKAALKIAELACLGVDEDSAGAPEPTPEEEPLPETLDWEDWEVEPELPEEACPAECVEEPRRSTKMTMENVLRLPSRYGPPLKSRMYDAFVAMINMVRANPVSLLRAPGTNVTIMCTQDGKVWMPTNPQAPSRVISGYVANSLARGHLLDSRGLTLYVGRSQRFATDGQVAALLALWGHQCAMPGCTHSRFIEIHHIHEWADGGGTDIGNLIPLCSSCHSKVTHGLAHIEIVGGAIEFRFLDGSVYRTPNRCLPTYYAEFEGPLLGYSKEEDLTFA